MNWISVKERLPEVELKRGFSSYVCVEGEVDVIAYSEGHVFATTFIRTIWDKNHKEEIKWIMLKSFGDECDYADNVTHWMPLPEPPTNEFKLHC